MDTSSSATRNSHRYIIAFRAGGRRRGLTHLDDLWIYTSVRMNEGGCDPDGRFYCGSMAYDQRPGAGALHRLDPDGSVRLVLENVIISNRLEWSPDDFRAYYNDTPTQRTEVYDYYGESGLTGRPSVRRDPGRGRRS
jgi:sugar lactone lactonase YvrE